MGDSSQTQRSEQNQSQSERGGEIVAEHLLQLSENPAGSISFWLWALPKWFLHESFFCRLRSNAGGVCGRGDWLRECGSSP